MNEEEFYALLKKLQIPIAYNHFSATQKPPYGVYYRQKNDHVAADSGVWHKFKNLVFELYTAKRDPALESKVEQLLDGAELFYNVYESWVEDEKIYQISYEIQI